MENAINIDDLGVPLFQETSILVEISWWIPMGTMGKQKRRELALYYPNMEVS